jgi:superfamily II DNA or RNA helicase
MSRRFPTPLFGVERAPDWTPELFDIVTGYDGQMTKETLIQVCERRLTKPDGTGYSESYVRRSLSTLISMGILREEDDNKITLWEFGKRHKEDDIEYPEFLWRAIKQSWVLSGNFPEGIEGLRRIHKVVRNSDEPLKSNEILDRLTEEFEYEYNVEGIRGYPEVLKQLGALKETERGYVTGPKSNTLEGRLRNADIFYQLERWIHHLGPNGELPEEELKKTLAKYYLYRESGGWGRHRRLYKDLIEDFIRETSRKSDVANPQIHLSKKYRENKGERDELFDDIKEKFSGIGGQDLEGLYAGTLEDILEAETEKEARKIIESASPGISRRNLKEWYDDGRDSYTYSSGFSLYDWQEEAIESWFGGDSTPSEEGIAQVVTGAGKTVMAVGAMERWLEDHPEGVVTVVVPTKVLMHQWLRELIEKLNVPPSEIGWAGGGHKDSHDERRIIVSIINSAVKNDYLEKSLGESPSDEHLLVADECHRYTGDVHSKVLGYPNTATLGLSATPLSTLNPDEEELTEDDELLLGRLGKVFYRLTYEEGVERGLVSEFEIKYVGFDLTPAEGQVYEELSRKVSSAVNDIKVRYENRLYDMNGSFPQKLQVILQNSDHPTPKISDFFEYTSRRKELVAEAVPRLAITHNILERSVERGDKSIVFQERIDQLEEMVAPWDRRAEETQTGEYGSENPEKVDMYRNYESEKEEVEREMEELFFDTEYAPVMYHSGHHNQRWNDWSIEWFRDEGFANTMLSVQALTEGVDVPSADVGIVRVSSGNVRKMIQTLGRILRTGHDPDKPSEMYVLYARDTVDENIFRGIDWESEIGGEHRYYKWETNEGVIGGELRGPDPSLEPEVTSYKKPEAPDPSKLERGDPYEGPREGRSISVDSRGRPFRNMDGRRKFIVNSEIRDVAEYVHELKGGGKIKINDEDHMLTVTEEGPVFLGVLQDDEFEYEKEPHDEEVPETFDDFIDQD